MAHTPNMQILSFLLQNPEILEYTDPEIQAIINALPELNSFRAGDAPKGFLYDATEGIICYADPENPDIQEILKDFSEPSFRFPNIAIYQVG